MRIVCLSDTHNKPMMEQVPDGDILIHAGDATIRGTFDEVVEFAKWFYSLPHLHKIFVPGNHDWLYQRNPKMANSLLPSLHDQLIEIEGLRIYGSSWQPEFHNWAFGLPRGEQLREVWANIPESVDILVTHTPPRHIRDKIPKSGHVGCDDLYSRVLSVRPKLHVFGHIHSSYGTTIQDGTIFVNASICNEAYEAKRKPIVIEL